MSRSTVIFFGLCLLSLGLCVAYFAIWPVYKMREWPTTTCTILRSELTSYDEDDSSRDSIDLEYSYLVAGQRLIGKRYSHINPLSSWRFTRAALAKRLPSGTQVPCFYNAREPSQVVLSRALGEDWQTWALMLSLLCVGAGLILLMLLGPQVYMKFI